MFFCFLLDEFFSMQVPISIICGHVSPFFCILPIILVKCYVTPIFFPAFVFLEMNGHFNTCLVKC